MQQQDITKPLNNVQRGKLEKIYDEMFREKEYNITKELDKNIDKAETEYLKSPGAKRLLTILKQKAKLNQEIKKITQNNPLSVQNNYSGYDTEINYNSCTGQDTPEVTKAEELKATKLEKMKKIKREIRMKLWNVGTTYEELQNMVNEKLNNL